MRIALISDIHGNLVALEAVLADLESEAPGAVICLGDVLVTGPQPHQVLDLLRERDWPIVMGNTDAWALNPTPWEDTDEDSRRLEEIERWGATSLREEDLAFIRTFQPTVSLDLGKGIRLLAYHGSPRSNTDFIVPTTSEDELKQMLAGHQATVMVGGHTHQQMLRRFQNSLLVNPGSVGMPYETVGGHSHNPLWAEYALVTQQNSHLSVQFRRVPINLEYLTKAVKRSDMPHADWWLKDWR